jgi:hypothetical protein
VLDGFHPFDRCGQELLAFYPLDGHLARHRPVAGVLLDALLSGHELFPKTDLRFSKIMPGCEPSMARTRCTHGLIEKPKTAFPKPRAKNARDMRA